MFAAMELANYTASEADDLRKAIAKKIPEKLHQHRQKFIDGSVKNNISPKQPWQYLMIGKNLPDTVSTRAMLSIMASLPCKQLS